MKLPIIDADGHVMEPFDLWEERLPEQYRDRAWKRVMTPSGEQVSFLLTGEFREFTDASHDIAPVRLAPDTSDH